MPADLTSLTARVAACLQDTTHLVYPLEAIAEALRQALAALSTALGRKLTLAGLDGASTSTLPENLESLAVQGSAALVVSGRALRHAEQPALAPEGLTPVALTWAETVLGRFRASCEYLRAACLRGEVTPWAENGWPLDQYDGRDF
jgi:hypothetical protein